MSVKVDGTIATKQGERYCRTLAVDNSERDHDNNAGTPDQYAGVWKGIVVEDNADGNPTFTCYDWVDPAQVTPSHDADGNLTQDGRWTYVWDAENRLVEMTTLDDVLDVGGPYRRLEFAYDWRSRRVSKKCFTGSPGSETVSDERRFVYDGWQLISEYEVVGGDLTIDRTYAWGIDLSGTLQGAGGVGGLLSFDNGTSCFVPSYDGNGNVIGWMKDTGACVAVCEYDAFGRRVVCEELEAGGADCPIRPQRFIKRTQ
jgi:YD repeat-containing protein